MTRIAIAALTYDLNSPLELEILPESTLQEMSRRVTRSQTLDLGVSIVDNGFCHGDRTLRVKARVTEIQAELLLYLIRTYSLLSFSMPDGLFSGVIETCTNDSGEVSFSILVNEKLSGD